MLLNQIQIRTSIWFITNGVTSHPNDHICELNKYIIFRIAIIDVAQNAPRKTLAEISFDTVTIAFAGFAINMNI